MCRSIKGALPIIILDAVGGFTVDEVMPFHKVIAEFGMPEDKVTLLACQRFRVFGLHCYL